VRAEHFPFGEWGAVDGLVTYASDRAADLLCLGSRDVLDTGWVNGLLAEEREGAEEEMRRCVAGRRLFDMTARNRSGRRLRLRLAPPRSCPTCPRQGTAECRKCAWQGTVSEAHEAP